LRDAPIVPVSARSGAGVPDLLCALEQICAHLIAHQTITVAQVRDRFTTSRKYALALMEYLDAQGLTKRVGDKRVRGTLY
jgi:selenocysteine-specific elongation factor